jgi:hypothetical protein
MKKSGLKVPLEQDLEVMITIKQLRLNKKIFSTPWVLSFLISISRSKTPSELLPELTTLTHHRVHSKVLNIKWVQNLETTL